MSIVLTDLLKRYGDLVVVNHVNLEVADGELFVLLGGSGSGKSTVLRIIAGLSDPDGGRVVLHGRDVTDLSPQKRDTGFVFQNYSIFRHMTVSENVEFGLKLRKVSAEESRRRCDELLEIAGLTGLGRRYPDQLSGGQQQRVALARALAYKPAVLLLDEPFGALDVKIRAQLRRSLKEIQQQLNVTTILVTHDQEEAFELADRIGVIERGRLLEVGTPEELYLRPKSQFVAGFVGTANLLVGAARAGAVELGAARLELATPAPAYLDGAPVRVLFRPEDVVAQREPIGEGLYRLGRGRVVESVFAGSLVRLKLAVEELRGVRVLSPPPVYGQEHPPIEAVVAGCARAPAVGDELFVGLSAFHVLERTGLKGMVLWSDPAVARFGALFLASVDAPGSLLVRDGEPPAQEGFERLAMVRGGPSLAQDIQEGSHELVFLGPSHRALASTVLFQARVPVLYVPGERQRLTGRVLICTAAGGPGEGDVWLGGRICLRSRAQATVLHVLRRSVDRAQRARSERHLERAAASLASMGVQAEVAMVEGDQLLDIIFSQARERDVDLIVIGASDPAERLGARYKGLDLPILQHADRPVLVVPNL